MITSCKPNESEIVDFSKQIDIKSANGQFPETIYNNRCRNDEPNDYIVRHGVLYLLNRFI